MFENQSITTYNATVLGAKRFKGEIEGVSHDSCKILVATPMPMNGNSVGFTVSEIKFGESKNFERFQGLKFPIAMQLTVEMTSTGRGLVPVLLDFTPITTK